VAGMDLLLLSGAGVAIYAARRLSRSRLVPNERDRRVRQRTEAADAG